MKNVKIDNSVVEDMGRVVLWQYDKAPNLLGMLSIIESYFRDSTESFWGKRADDDTYDGWIKNVSDIDTANDFGLSVWGIVLGIQRPTVVVDNTTKTVSQDFYRRLLKGKYWLMRSNFSNYALNKYLSIVFDGRISVQDNQNMSITYSVSGELSEEEQYLFDNNKEVILPYPAAVRSDEVFEEIILGFEGQEPVDSTDPKIDTLDNATFSSEFTFISVQ